MTKFSLIFLPVHSFTSRPSSERPRSAEDVRREAMKELLMIIIILLLVQTCSTCSIAHNLEVIAKNSKEAPL